MDKTLKDGTIYHNAKFLRTTCKYCGKQLTKELINNGYYFCDKLHKKLFVRRSNNKKHNNTSFNPMEQECPDCGYLFCQCREMGIWGD